MGHVISHRGVISRRGSMLEYFGQSPYIGGYWPMMDDAKDAGSNGYTLTAIGTPIPVLKSVGDKTAWNFPGVMGSCLAKTTDCSEIKKSPISFMGWVLPTSFAVNAQVWHTGLPGSNYFTVLQGISGGYSGIFRIGAIGRTCAVIPAGSAKVNTPALISITYDNLICKGYFNGEYKSETAPAVTGPIEYPANGSVYIGSTTTINQPFSGLIWDVMIYTRPEVLTRHEVADYYAWSMDQRQRKIISLCGGNAGYYQQLLRRRAA